MLLAGFSGRKANWSVSVFKTGALNHSAIPPRQKAKLSQGEGI